MGNRERKREGEGGKEIGKEKKGRRRREAKEVEETDKKES